jgi:superfamily II DNA or RNA helicase
LAAHANECLAYLVAKDRLRIRFVLMRNGMYHKKQWLFTDGANWAAVHGSGNATSRGLLSNGEQMTIDRPWADGVSARIRVSKLVDQFERQWNNRHPESLSIEPAQAIVLLQKRGAGREPPTVDEFWEAWRKDAEEGKEPSLPPGVHAHGTRPSRLSIPKWLDWHKPPYSHQAVAIERLEAAGGSGILSIATGGGKTRTSLIAAARAQERDHGPMLVVVLVPSTPLALQWQDDVREFGVEPRLLSGESPTERDEVFAEVSAALQGGSATAVLIASNQLFARDSGLRRFVERQASSSKTLLIGDEVHNLGAPSFVNDLPHAFQVRIGLSATPIRQYDPDGTDRLFDYFRAGGTAPQPVFTYTLDQAIKDGCLVPYRYWVHPVLFTGAEMDRYRDLTDKLRAAGFAMGDDEQLMSNATVERLLRERRALIEQADGKIAALRRLLVKAGPHSIGRTLVYTSAKPAVPPHSDRQIDSVTSMLSDLGVISHQFTNAETSRHDAQDLLAKFGRGEYQVLTAMKVLDEGIDIPQTNVAYLLASSTVQREWVQRRGRILRRAEGKQAADLHDFVVVPPDVQDPYGIRLLRGELGRVTEFGRIALNEYDPGGAVDISRRIENGTWRPQ